MRHIAETIWQQLNMSGASLPMSWGAHALKTLPEGTIDNDFDCQQGGLQFMVHGALFKGHVRVILAGNDTYTVCLGRARAGTWKEHMTFRDVYCDELAGVVDTSVETAPVAANAVNEDTPDYGGFNRDDLEHIIMDDDNPMTCPLCGARTTVEEEYPNGEQLHFCETDSCIMGHFLAVEPEPAKDKLCRCGCGEMTNRTFVQGHDLKFLNKLKDKAGSWDELEEAVNDFFYKNQS